MKWRSRLFVLLATAICAVSAEAGGRWLWPDEVVSAPRSAERAEQPVRQGAARVIQSQPGLIFNNPSWLGKDAVQFFSASPPPKPQPILPTISFQPTQPSPPRTPGIQSPVSAPPPPPIVTSQPAIPPSSGLLSSTTERSEAAVLNPEDDIETASKEKKNSSVPLLIDAGKPGNPYELLNKIFPPEKSIRTKEEEEANLNSLANEDLGGLDPHEVYLSDGDLLVIRGFNFKKPYNPDPAGPPISDYEAPAPNPPPPPEPGTVFYPISNDTDTLPGFPLPDFNETDFSSFIPGGLDGNSTGGIPFLPFPFLPPPPPPFDSTKEEADPFGESPFPPGPPGSFPPGPFGNQGQGPPGSFPPALFGNQGQRPPGSFPPAQFGNQVQEPPGSFPPVQFGNQGQGPPGSFSPGPFGNQGQGPPGSFPPGPFRGPGQGPSFPPGLGGQFPPGSPGGAPPGSSSPAPPPPSGLPPRGPLNESAPLPPGFPEFIFPGNFTEDDDFVPFTPLFPSRPVEYYYPKHNTTALPPGPFGPGIFVPPPKSFFAPRNQSEELSVRIPSALFKPPFNLPNYYEKPKVIKQNLRVVRPQILQVQNQLAHRQPVINPQPHPFLGNFPLVPNVRVVQDSSSSQGNRYQPGSLRQPQVVPVQRQPVYGSGPVTFGRPAPPAPKPISLESDINVNFRNPRPEIDPDSELIDVSLLQPQNQNQNQNQNGRPAAPKKPATYEANKPLKYIYNQRLPGANLQPQPSREAYVSVYRNDGGSYSYNLNRRR